MTDIKSTPLPKETLLSPVNRSALLKSDSIRFIGIEVNVEKEHRFALSPLDVEENSLVLGKPNKFSSPVRSSTKKSLSPTRKTKIVSEKSSFRNKTCSPPPHRKGLGIDLNSKEFEKFFTPYKKVSPKRDQDTVYHDAHSTTMSSPGYSGDSSSSACV